MEEYYNINLTFSLLLLVLLYKTALTEFQCILSFHFPFCFHHMNHKKTTPCIYPTHLKPSLLNFERFIVVDSEMAQFYLYIVLSCCRLFFCLQYGTRKNKLNQKK